MAAAVLITGIFSSEAAGVAHLPIHPALVSHPRNALAILSGVPKPQHVDGLIQDLVRISYCPTRIRRTSRGSNWEHLLTDTRVGQ